MPDRRAQERGHVGLDLLEVDLEDVEAVLLLSPCVICIKICYFLSLFYFYLKLQ